MNITLTDIRSLTLQMQELPVVAQKGQQSFSGLLREQLPGDADNISQVVDYKEFYLESSLPQVGPESPNARLPDAAWQEYLAQTRISASADADAIKPVQLASQQTLSMTADLTAESTVDAVLLATTGEQLPAGGKQLPEQHVVMPEADVDMLTGYAGIQPLDKLASASAVIAAHDSSQLQSILQTAPSQPAPTATLDQRRLVELTTNAARLDEAVEPGLEKKLPEKAPGEVVSALLKPSKSDMTSRLPDVLPQVAGSSPGHLSEVAKQAVSRPANLSGITDPAPAAITPGAQQATATVLVNEIIDKGRFSANQTLAIDEPAARAAMQPQAETVPPAVGEASRPGAAPEPLNPAAPAGKNNPEAVATEMNVMRNVETSTQTASTAAPQLHNLAAAGSPISANLSATAQPGNMLSPHQPMSLSNSADAEQWGNGLAERVNWMINKKQDMALIRLDPPTLGKLDVQIKVSDEITHITIQTQHAQTRDLIESASFRLREFLQENGYQNVNVDVSHRQDQQQARAQSQAGDSETSADESSPEQIFGEVDQDEAHHQFSADGLLDTFA